MSWVKVNTDAAVIGDRTDQATYAGVFRDHKGNWLEGFMRNIGASSVLLAELQGIALALEVGWQKADHRLVIGRGKLVSPLSLARQTSLQIFLLNSAFLVISTFISYMFLLYIGARLFLTSDAMRIAPQLAQLFTTDQWRNSMLGDIFTQRDVEAIVFLLPCSSIINFNNVVSKQKLGGAIAEIMSDLLAFVDDRRVVNITMNRYPYGHEELAVCKVIDQALLDCVSRGYNRSHKFAIEK
ncbi:hypothetical protein Fmac_017574 [Flemingia macrophylla]|uniref:RNase H type-1 domain-containing protein n=1 Tax=Flemingia macrophylla TaxID=520843 RepID=A0ABD1M2H5_9FABA